MITYPRHRYQFKRHCVTQQLEAHQARVMNSVQPQHIFLSWVERGNLVMSTGASIQISSKSNTSSSWPKTFLKVTFIEGSNYCSRGPSSIPQFLCNPEETDSEKRRLNQKLCRFVAANLDTGSVIPSSLFYTIFCSVYKILCSVYKILQLGVYKFLFHIFT